jgi:hypothetical protein
MLRNLCALVFLALAVSPFTAPFQTYDDAEASITAPFNNGHDPGSLVAPMATKAGRLRVAPPTALAVSHFVPVALLTPFIQPATDIRGESIRPTVLRV